MLDPSQADPTEPIRRALVAVVNADPARTVADLGLDARTYTTDEVREAYTVETFAAPFVVVTRKADGQRGTLMFTHHPRVYFGFEADA